MSRKEIPVGEIICTPTGKRYEVVIALGCHNCAFERACSSKKINCDSSSRKDGNPIIFKRRKDLE